MEWAWLKVVVLGAAGFVGTNLLETINSKEFEILASDITDVKINNIPFVKSDITSFEEVSKLIKGSDIVVHLAAHSLAQSFEEILTNAKVNVMGVLNVLEASRIADVKNVIFSSASSVIGTPQQSLVDESHPCAPKTPYGVTKLASEHYFRIYNETYGMNYAIFRFFNIYGRYQTTGLIPNIYYKLSNNSPIDVYGDGSQLRDYVYVKDLIPFLVRAITDDAIKNKIINMGTGKGTSVLEVIELAAKILGKKPLMQFHPNRKGEIGNFVPDIKLLKSLFGTIPSTPLEQGLRQTFAWLAKQK